MLEDIVASEGIIAVATVVLAIITGYYAYESRRMRLDAQKPKIAINPYCSLVRENSITLICLRIENIGPGPAYDVQFETDLNFRLNMSISLGNIYIFRKGINYLKPGGQKNCQITRNELERQKETPLKIAVTYKDWRNKEYSESFCIDFNETRGVLDAVPEN